MSEPCDYCSTYSITGPIYHEEEPMPDLTKTPTVHLATVVSTWEPDYTDNRENGELPSVTVRLDRYTKLPRLGDRIVVSSSTEGIFGWIREQTTAREDVLDAAIAWADDCWNNNVRWVEGSPIDRLLKATLIAKGFTASAAATPREEEAPSGGTETEGDGIRTFVVRYPHPPGATDEWCLHNGDRLVILPDNSLAVIMGHEESF